MNSVNLFVYGTLLGGGTAGSRLTGCELVGAATVHGTLYDIDGEYPALVLAGNTPIHGQIWRCPSTLLYELDTYEGVSDALFRRVGVQVAEHACWTYVAGPALARRLTPARRIVDGKWNGVQT